MMVPKAWRWLRATTAGPWGLFWRAAARWEEMGRPYDQARAISGLGRAHDGIEDRKAASDAFDQALDLYDALAAQLEGLDLKRSFLTSQPVREVREARAALRYWEAGPEALASSVK